MLTVDSESTDRRRKDFNQAVFATEERGGYAIWNRTTLGMVMKAFDKAARETEHEE